MGLTSTCVGHVWGVYVRAADRLCVSCVDHVDTGCLHLLCLPLHRVPVLLCLGSTLLLPHSLLCWFAPCVCAARYGGRLPERTAVELVLHPFLLVINYLHQNGIAHRCDHRTAAVVGAGRVG